MSMQGTFDGAGISTLRSRFRGALLRPGEEGYDESRRIWNGAIDRRPAIIARCVGADDVVEAVRFARETGMQASVRGGGHAVAGHAVCEGGLMIDLSLMKSVRVDPATRIARAAGGMLWSDLDRATQAFGLATTGGVISHTGIGGLTLGGGLGHLMRKHGLTVDNLLAVDLVTADGQRMRVDEQSDPELFWGLRGGGGNFGIATSFDYRLHPVGPTVLGGPIFWRAKDAPEVLRYMREFAPVAPDELGMTMVLRSAPPLPFLPPEHHFQPVLGMVLLWAGAAADGERVIAPLRALASPIGEMVRPVPYVMLQSSLDAGAPHGMHYYWKSHRVAGLSDAVIDQLTDGASRITSPMSQIGIWAVGGAASGIDAGATAVGAREVGFELNVVGTWTPNDPDPARHVSWVRESWETLRPSSVGMYVNFVSDEGAAGVAAAYGARVERLTALKDRIDPTNFFRMNANIPPSDWP